jgi:hypothetical protein
MWMLKKTYEGKVGLGLIHSLGGQSSNTPELFVDTTDPNNHVPKLRLYDHTTEYSVLCKTEQLR